MRTTEEEPDKIFLETDIKGQGLEFQTLHTLLVLELA